MRPQEFFFKCLTSRGQSKTRAGVPPVKVANQLADALQAGNDRMEHIDKLLESAISLIQSIAEADSSYSVLEPDLDEVDSLLTEDIPMRLVEHLAVLDVQARTLIANFWCMLLQPGLPHGMDKQVLHYVCSKPQLLELLLEGCREQQACPHFGIILRSSLRHQVVVEAFLERSYVFRLLDLAQHPCFEVSTDAFDSLRQVLLGQKSLCSHWLLANQCEFFRRFDELLEKGSYVVQRQALKLLSELLLDRGAMKLMLAYLEDERHLCIHMNLLRDSSRTLQFEAFHLFKLFAANPNKTPRVHKILCKNQLRLIELIDNLKPTSGNDDLFSKDKKSVISKLQALSSMSTPTKALAAVSLKDDKARDVDASPYAASNASTNCGCGSSVASESTTDRDDWTASQGCPHRLVVPL